MQNEDHEKPQVSSPPPGNPEVMDEADTQDGVVHHPVESMPVVGLGGSAGSLSALSSFVSNIAPDSGAAYVIVVHLSPEHEDMLPEILQRETSIPVKQVNGEVTLCKNEIYVISPGKQLWIKDGTLVSSALERPLKSRHVTIDVFFRTLADAYGIDACAIILSGMDGDGAVGLKRIKERGGLTIVQDPFEAEFDEMPRSAIATGMVDWILPAAETPSRLKEYWANARKMQLPWQSHPESNITNLPSKSDESTLKDILGFLDSRCGHDFSDYKHATIIRRVARRMQVNGTQTLADYLTYLRTHPGESGALLQDLLISVTNYFRDSKSFDALKEIIPSLFSDKTGSGQIRIWVPGCATGEEAYSIAILLCEHAKNLTHSPSIQIFATDLDQNAISFARDGKYPQTIAADLSEERLKRFFIKKSDGYQVKRVIREMILFATHDLLRDPPFSHLDLISCRNLLIYLNRKAQSKVIDIFHYALRPSGKLFLGSSESVEEITGLFAPIDKSHRLYIRKEVQRLGFHLPTGRSSYSFPINVMSSVPFMIPGLDEKGEYDSQVTLASGPADLHLKLIERLAPPSVVVNRGHDIIHLSKGCGKYLQLSGGEPSTHLLKLIHQDLRTAVCALLFQAAEVKTALQSRNVTFRNGDVESAVNITVEAMEPESQDFFLVIFEDQDLDKKQRQGAPEVAPNDLPLVRHLERELDQLRTSWRETMKEYETTLEELKASNEELHAMNEELRSTSEEMETGREEIITINQELKRTIEELRNSNSDLQNLMASTNIATIFLDHDLKIKLFTPSCTELFSLIPGDKGRQLSDISCNLDYSAFKEDAANVLKNMSMVERELKSSNGKWFLLRLSPYQTEEDLTIGLVMTFIDITERKRNLESLRWLSHIVDSSTDAVISFTQDWSIASWNKGAERIFGYSSEEIMGKSHAVLVPESKQDEKKELLGRLLCEDSIQPFETIRTRKDGKMIDVSLSASVIRDDNGEIVGATTIARDISARKQAMKDLKQARNDLEDRVKERTAELRQRVNELAHMAAELTFTEERERKRMARILHDELQQLLVSAKMGIQSLDGLDDEARKWEIKNLTKLMDDVIANSRSLSIDLSPPVLCEPLGCALEWLCLTWMREKHHLCVHTDIDLSLDARSEEIRSIIFYTVRELLFNVVKHSAEMEAHVEMVHFAEDQLKVTVRDHGLGFDLDGTDPTKQKATGFGLMGLRERLEMLGVHFTIQSQPNKGVEAVIIAPRKMNHHE
jgi:two-component system CheB/CheR fusion protein